MIFPVVEGNTSPVSPSESPRARASSSVSSRIRRAGFAERHAMLLSAFGVVARYGPFLFGAVDLVPWRFSDFAASGRCEGEEYQRVDGYSVGVGCFNGPDGVL